MTETPLLRHVRRLMPADIDSDADLLARFAATRNDAAFEALVRRHAGLVWRICRRTLGHATDAEDAFQATFLVLARHPRRVLKAESVTAYLFGVALRVSLKARTKRNRIGPMAKRPQVPDAAGEAALRELQSILDEEVLRLPAKYRDPFVLCVIDGRPRAVAAAELGLNPGTLSTRLARARELLRTRLAMRGVQLAAALTVIDLAQAADVAPAALLTRTIDGIATPAVAALASGANRLPLLSGLLGTVAAAATAAAFGFAPVEQKPEPKPTPTPFVLREEPKLAVDIYGDPLPPGASARLGTDRFKQVFNLVSVAYSPDGKHVAGCCTLTGGLLI